MQCEREAANLFRRLGVNNSYVGFRYTAYGVARAALEPDLIVYISKGLYVEIAAHYQTSVECVERNIQTVVRVVWEHGDRALLSEMFGRDLVNKPRNGAFIDALAQYLKIPPT